MNALNKNIGMTMSMGRPGFGPISGVKRDNFVIKKYKFKYLQSEGPKITRASSNEKVETDEKLEVIIIIKIIFSNH